MLNTSYQVHHARLQRLCSMFPLTGQPSHHQWMVQPTAVLQYAPVCGATYHQTKPAPLSALSSCSQHIAHAEQAHLMELQHCHPRQQVYLLHACWHDALP
jgi:hypothetical protein